MRKNGIYDISITINNRGCSISKIDILQAKSVFVFFFRVKAILFVSARKVRVSIVREFIEIVDVTSDAGPSYIVPYSSFIQSVFLLMSQIIFPLCVSMPYESDNFNLVPVASMRMLYILFAIYGGAF